MDRAEDTTARRKDSHLDLAATGDVEPAGNRTLLNCVHLVHCAMPELAVEDIDASVPFMGKVLRCPLLKPVRRRPLPLKPRLPELVAPMTRRCMIRPANCAVSRSSTNPSRSWKIC